MIGNYLENSRVKRGKRPYVEDRMRRSQVNNWSCRTNRGQVIGVTTPTQHFHLKIYLKCNS